jgi:excisionase family DNA binding protein
MIDVPASVALDRAEVAVLVDLVDRMLFDLRSTGRPARLGGRQAEVVDALRARLRADRVADIAGRPRTPANEAAGIVSYMSTNTAAEVLGISDRQVRRLVADNVLGAHKTGNAWRLDAADVHSLKEFR